MQQKGRRTMYGYTTMRKKSGTHADTNSISHCDIITVQSGEYYRGSHLGVQYILRGAHHGTYSVFCYVLSLMDCTRGLS